MKTLFHLIISANTVMALATVLKYGRHELLWMDFVFLTLECLILYFILFSWCIYMCLCV